jgi:hypothetical protein
VPLPLPCPIRETAPHESEPAKTKFSFSFSRGDSTHQNPFPAIDLYRLAHVVLTTGRQLTNIHPI